MKRYTALFIIGAGLLFGIFGGRLLSFNGSESPGPEEFEIGSSSESDGPAVSSEAVNLYSLLVGEKEMDKVDTLWMSAGYNKGTSPICPTEKAGYFVPEDSAVAGFAKNSGAAAVHMVNRYAPGIVNSVFDAYKEGALSCSEFRDTSGSGTTTLEQRGDVLKVTTLYEDQNGVIEIVAYYQKVDDIISSFVIAEPSRVQVAEAEEIANMVSAKLTF